MIVSRSRHSVSAPHSTGSDLDTAFRVVWPDGVVHWITCTAKAFPVDGGPALYMTGACADVTSRRAAAEALHTNEARLQAIFNQAAVGITVADLDGHFLDMNGKFSDILGFTADELRERTFYDITHPDDVVGNQALLRRLLNGSVAEFAMEKRYIRSDGAVVWSLTTVTLLSNGAGAPQHFVAVIEDITARKHAEEALAEERRMLALLEETGRLVAGTLDLQPLLQAITDAATTLCGAEVGAFFYNIADASGEHFLLHALSGAARESFYKTADASGERFLLYALSGAPRESFDYVRQPRATALVGPTFRGEAPVRCGDVGTDPRYRAMTLHDGLPAGHRPVRSYLAVPVRSRDGTVLGGLFFGHSDPNVFTGRSERLIVGVAAQAGVAIDNARLYEAAQGAAAERTVLLERERAARQAAERMTAVQDEFLATLSHELRTPLNAILGWSQMLRSNPGARADLLRGLETIERNARVQTQLIEDLLDMSRIATGKLRLDIQSIQPAALIRASVETMKPAAQAKGLTLETALDPSAGPIDGDSSRLQQVVWNLLENAIKFTSSGGSVHVSLERVNAAVEISVTDTGVGIRTEFLPYLFERFRQGDATTTRTFGGLGLGLSIVKNIVELHGGTVRVESPGEGGGTTVIVSLPLTTGLHDDASVPESHPPTNEATATFVATELGGLKVLVVDDQADARDLITRVLVACAADVITASSAEEALTLLQTELPSLLISDIGMPDMDGFELIRRVRALEPEQGGRIPAIALTAFARSEDRTRALRAGFVAHLSKPVDATELAAAVASVARRAT